MVIPNFALFLGAKQQAFYLSGVGVPSEVNLKKNWPQNNVLVKEGNLPEKKNIRLAQRVAACMWAASTVAYFSAAAITTSKTGGIW